VHANSGTTLYIGRWDGHIPKNDIEKNTFVSYPIFPKKETSCKEIRVSFTKLKLINRRFPMNEEDRTRLEEFRQFRKEIRGSAEYLLVGIDVAKDKHYAFFWHSHRKDRGRRFWIDLRPSQEVECASQRPGRSTRPLPHSLARSPGYSQLGLSEKRRRIGCYPVPAVALCEGFGLRRFAQ